MEARGSDRPAAEEGEEPDSDRDEERHLEENQKAGADEGLLGVPESPAREQPLHDELVGAVARHREERSAEDTGPESCRAGAEIEIEDEEVDGLAGRGVGRRAPGDAAGNPRGQDNERGDGSGQVDENLDEVDPDDGLDSAEERVERGSAREDQDRRPDRAHSR